MRIRDKVFADDWKKKESEIQILSPIVLLHHLFGVVGIIIILFQSALSLNVYVFTIWMIIGILILLIDIARGSKITLTGELIFGFLFILGTGISLLLGDFTSMFFPDSLGRIDIILFQVFTGVSIVIRFAISLYFIEFKSHEGFYVVPTSIYAQEQLKHYQDNLLLTDFERKKTNENRFLKKWGFLLQRMLWPSVIMLILVIFAIGYALLIYFIIPNNTIAEFVVRPSLIVVAILYTILLLRTHALLPKVIEKPLSTQEEDKPTEVEELISELELIDFS